jgi:hypothetical protein
VYLTIRLISEISDQDLNKAEIDLLIASTALKVLLDGVGFMIFMQSFLYFVNRKASTLKREALSFSPFNKFIIASVFFLYVMRIIGTLFTLTNAIISITDLYTTHSYSVYRLLMADIIFPLRDMIEVLFFTYLFYF